MATKKSKGGFSPSQLLTSTRQSKNFSLYKIQ